MPIIVWFVAYLLAEVFSIVWVASALGFWATLLLMLISFFMGSAMLRNMGASATLLSLAVLRSKNENVSFYQLLWPARYAIAAILLILPGFIGTLIAVILLLPFKGKPLANNENMEQVIDGEFTEIKHHQIDEGQKTDSESKN